MNRRSPLPHGPVLHGDGTVTFSVWAPRPASVELDLRGERHAMQPAGRGWWQLRTTAAAGDRYGYVLDGGDVLPDPASRRQPDGVHGTSALVDLDGLEWSAGEATWRPPPWDRAVIYELHVGTFSTAGDLDGAIEHLDDLVDLGITHVELMPLNAVNGTHNWGYDGVGWYAVHEPYGGPEALVRFVDAAHRAGLAVVLDVVHNHLGPSGNYLPDFGPIFSEGRSTWGESINLDGPGSDAVRDLIVGNVVYWLEHFGVDGLRLDAVHALVDSSATHVLAEIADAVAAVEARTGRPRVLIAESDRNDPGTVRPRVLGGMGMTAQWADELHHAVHVALTGEDEGWYADFTGLADVAEAWTRGFVMDGSRWSVYRQRTVGAPLGDVDGRRLIGCLQNHDQVGNRARGDRLTQSVARDLLAVGAALVACAPHTPMLFMGEEWGATTPFCFFTSHPEPELAESTRVGRTEEFAEFTAFGGEVCDPQDPETFRASRLDRREADTETGRWWRELWRDLLLLRRAEPALHGGRRDLVDIRHVDAQRFLARRRHPGAASVLVAANLSDEPFPVPEADGWEFALSTDRGRHHSPDRLPGVACSSRSVTIWRSS